jgi:hypothetical protein
MKGKVMQLIGWLIGLWGMALAGIHPGLKLMQPSKGEIMATARNPSNSSGPEGVVSGLPNLLLRGEGALVLAAATYAYAQHGSNWWMFAVLFFVPDIFMLGFLGGNRWGAIVYNIGHTYTVPAALLTAGWFWSSPLMIVIALIWIGHIGFDRILGYGLKYDRGFKFSHLSAPRNWPVQQ